MKTIKKTILSFTLVFFMMILPVGDSAGMVTAQAQTMVYVTPTGSKYHTHKCGRGNFYQTTLSNALARGLTPCKKCFGSSGGYSQTRKSSTTTTKKTTKKKNTRPKISPLSISSTKIVLVKGQSRKLTVKGGAGIVSWGSSNTAVAGVSAGKVVAKGKGKATITVKKGTQKKSCQVTVETPELNKTAVEMDVEDTVSLDLKGCSHDVEWTSSDDDICEVEDGILIPYSSGTVTVKAKVHGMVWKCKVVITDSTEDDWNDDLDDDSDDDSENAKNKWSTGHNVYPPKHQGYFEDFPEWHEKDLRAMVRRDRNHPSIILWSIGNEIDYPNDPYCHPSFLEMTGNNDANKPAAERQYDPAKPDMRRLLPIAEELSSIVKSEDESRPVTMALAYPELSAKLGMLEHLDVAGYNYKEQYYEADHKDFPQIPFLGSENGHSYEAWDAVKSNDYISGQFLWTGIDYLGEAHGWPVHGSGAGILDCAGFEKARYYRRKSLWCEEPQLYLATRPWSEESAEWIPCRENWNYKAGEKVIVMCYSNLPETAVFINGKEAGRQIGYNDDGAYRFEVFWEAGILEASGYDENGNIIEQERLLTTQNAAGIKAEVYQPEEIPFSETQENGYLYQVALTLVDQNGQKVVWDDKKLRVAVSGAGMLAGIENGDLSDVTPYAENARKTKDGRLMIYVRRIKKGKIRVEISETDSIAEISTITEKNRITGKTGIAEKDSTEEKGGMHLEVEMD